MLTCDAKATGGKRVWVSSARRTCREANGAGGGGPDGAGGSKGGGFGGGRLGVAHVRHRTQAERRDIADAALKRARATKALANAV